MVSLVHNLVARGVEEVSPGNMTFSFDGFLKSDQIVTLRNEMKIVGIARCISGSISSISSICLACIIIRSRDGLSTVFHRLLFGVCISDIMSSFAAALSNFVVPKDLDYFVWEARGNTASCEASAFLYMVGSSISTLYTASLCIYFYAIVKCNKSEVYIRKKIEPWLHGISLTYSLCVGVTLLAKEALNAHGSHCAGYAHYPPHCIGYEEGTVVDGYEVPCGRGGSGALSLGLSLMCPPIFVTPIVIVATMAIMYQKVLKLEKRMQKYGIGALRLKKIKLTADQEAIETNPGIFGTIKSFCNCFRNNSQGTKQTPSKSKSNCGTSSQSRAILNQAFAYTVAWVASWILVLVMTFMQLGEETIDETPFVVVLLVSITNPLQGFFNFLVFLCPKVRRAKKLARGELSWCQATVKILMSRGETFKKRKGTQMTSRDTEGGLQTTRKKRLKNESNQVMHIEDEKCEEQNGANQKKSPQFPKFVARND
jgi:hypothetical protein